MELELPAMILGPAVVEFLKMKDRSMRESDCEIYQKREFISRFLDLKHKFRGGRPKADIL